MTTTEKLTKIISEELYVKPEEVTPEATLESLECDSLDCVELAIAIEDEFQISIPDEDCEKVKTVKQIFELVESKL